MKTKLFTLLLVTLFFGSCQGQLKTKNSSSADSLSFNKPKENIKVNKKYDENGNLIEYDSVYSYSYSYSGNDFNINPDSLLRNFGFKGWDNGIGLFSSPFNFEFPFEHDSLMLELYNRQQAMQNYILKESKLFDSLFNDSLLIKPPVKHNFYYKNIF